MLFLSSTAMVISPRVRFVHFINFISLMITIHLMIDLKETVLYVLKMFLLSLHPREQYLLGTKNNVRSQ